MSGKFLEAYFQNVVSLLTTIEQTEKQRIIEAAKILADTLEHDGIIYVFGCGHSHMMAEELFYRAGGLAAINPIFEPSTMLHEGAFKSSQIERMSGYAPHVIDRYPIKEGDSFLVFSSSGINSFPIESAEMARQKGARVIGITSAAYQGEASRDKLSRHLPDVCDFWIDNHVPHGDAVISLNEGGQQAGPVSSFCSMFIANALVLEACDELQHRGVQPEIFTSGNIAGGEQRNIALIEKYLHRIKHL